MPTAITTEQVTDVQLSRYARLIYETSGIRISPQKKALLSNRLRRRLKVTGIHSFEAYFSRLRDLPANDAEWDAFLQEITTHETYLYRDESHWKWFQDVFLPEIIGQARRQERLRTLRVWSAACSTGDEAHTIACCVARGLASSSQWKVEILGTDIGVGAVEQARQGEFGERAMRLVPRDLARRHFTQPEGSQLWKAKPSLTNMLQFRQHNLLEPLCAAPFDLVVLKNVLIYFDKRSKQTVIDNIQKVLQPGTYLICGAAEGVSDMLAEFQRIEPWLFRK